MMLERKIHDLIVTIKQIGEVASLNVAVSASTAMYELNRCCTDVNKIIGTEYQVRQVGNGGKP